MPKKGEIQPVLERFMSKVVATADCWEWVGYKDSFGYGEFHLPGRHGGKTKAHRFIYQHIKGQLPDDIFVCHRCDNPSCVRPTHLFAGSAQDNALDMVAKGRHRDQKKTHCVHGHEFTPENTYVNTRGRRQCRTCAAAHSKAYLSRKKEDE